MSRIRTVVAAVGIAGILLAAAGIVLAVIAILPDTSPTRAFTITTGTKLVIQHLPGRVVWFQVAGSGAETWFAPLGVVLASAGAVALLVAAAVALFGITRLQRDTNGLV